MTTKTLLAAAALLIGLLNAPAATAACPDGSPLGTAQGCVDDAQAAANAAVDGAQAGANAAADALQDLAQALAGEVFTCDTLPCDTVCVDPLSCLVAGLQSAGSRFLVCAVTTPGPCGQFDPLVACLLSTPCLVGLLDALLGGIPSDLLAVAQAAADALREAVCALPDPTPCPPPPAAAAAPGVPDLRGSSVISCFPEDPVCNLVAGIVNPLSEDCADTAPQPLFDRLQSCLSGLQEAIIALILFIEDLVDCLDCCVGGCTPCHDFIENCIMMVKGWVDSAWALANSAVDHAQAAANGAYDQAWATILAAVEGLHSRLGAYFDWLACQLVGPEPCPPMPPPPA